jgi:F-type H+-transporting ATPase subunit delta
LAGRYATALFALADEQKTIDIVSASLDKVAATVDESADFRGLLTSPVLSRSVSEKAVAAVAASLELDTLTSNILGVLASNRRLAQLPAVIRAFRTLTARHRGEMTAEVTSAHPLSDAQLDALKTKLKARVGRDVAVTSHVDPAILGGLVVKVGSQMIDSSIRTKLNAMSQAMKG